MTITYVDDANFPSTLPSIPLHELDAPGVLFIHDYGRAACVTQGTVGNGTVLTNLARNTSAWTDQGQVRGDLVREGLGIRAPFSGGQGLAGYMVPAPGLGSIPNMSFLAQATFRLRDTNTGHGILGSAGNSQDLNDGQNRFVLLANGSGDFGITVRVWDQRGGSAGAHQYGVAGHVPGVGVLTHLGLAIQHNAGADSTLTLYHNGTVVLTTAVDGMRALYEPPRYPFQIATAGTTNQANATMYASSLENLTASGRAPATVAGADWAFNGPRFT